MVLFVPVYGTILILLLFLVLAVFPPRLHFGIRFASLVGLTGVLLLIGVFLPDVYFAAFPPITDVLEDLNGWMVAILAFAVSLPVALITWVIRKVMSRNAPSAT